jgi:hypothetical protein
MTAGSIALNITGDMRKVRRSILSMRHAFGAVAIAMGSFRRGEREIAQRHYSLGRELAKDHPGEWVVFCVTTNEGRCRVISRPRGGWGV